MLKSEIATGRPTRRAFPFFSTPLRVFAGVMGPIVFMMILLAAWRAVPLGIRLTAGAVVAISTYAFIRGYARRIEINRDEVRFRAPFTRFVIHWSDVRQVGRYVPLDRNRATQYVYITRLDSAPVDWREVDANTIQLQDREGLLEEIQASWDCFRASSEKGHA